MAGNCKQLAMDLFKEMLSLGMSPKIKIVREDTKEMEIVYICVADELKGHANLKNLLSNELIKTAMEDYFAEKAIKLNLDYDPDDAEDINVIPMMAQRNIPMPKMPQGCLTSTELRKGGIGPMKKYFDNFANTFKGCTKTGRCIIK